MTLREWAAERRGESDAGEVAIRRLPAEKQYLKRTCLSCGGLFLLTSAKSQKMYCRLTCPTERKRLHGVSPGTAGAIGELVVCADLLGRGWHVFRATSPASPVDLLAMRGSKTIRVEVTTGFMRVGKLAYTRKDASRFDVLAVVADYKSVFYPIGAELLDDPAEPGEHAVFVALPKGEGSA